MADGYDPALFVDKIDDEYICAICQCVYRDPVMLPCQHIYCKSCIIACLNANSECPMCRHFADLRQPLPVARMAANLIAKFRIYCRYKSSANCPFIGQMAEIEQHEATCDYRPMMCPNLMCGRMIACRLYQDHRLACDRVMLLVEDFYQLRMKHFATRNCENIRNVHLRTREEIKIKFASQANYLNSLDVFLEQCLLSFIKIENTLRGMAFGAVFAIAIGVGVAFATIPSAWVVAPVVVLSGVVGGFLGGMCVASLQKALAD